MLPTLFSFNLFGRTYQLYSYGVFLLLAMAVAVLAFYQLLKKRQTSTEGIFDNILWTIFAGLVGARLFYILFHFRFYLGNWREIFKFWEGGLDFFGAMAGGILVFSLWLYFKKRKELWLYLDCAAIALMFGLSIGMIGNFLIYEALVYFAIFIILLLLFRKSPKFCPGFVFFASLILFGAARFFLEFSRDPDIILYGPITLVHLLSLAVLIAGLIGIKWYNKQNLKSNTSFLWPKNF
jgi:phosphatidylglycerol:prolipoprotein diacylglycerol transferase